MRPSAASESSPMNFELAFYSLDHRLITLAMVAVLAVACELGFRTGSRNREAAEQFRSLMNGIGAAAFGLLGLLLGFTLAMAIGRWDARHDVVVAESNAIGTLSLRAGLSEQSIRVLAQRCSQLVADRLFEQARSQR